VRRNPGMAIRGRGRPALDPRRRLVPLRVAVPLHVKTWLARIARASRPRVTLGAVARTVLMAAYHRERVTYHPPQQGA
jgi:hypothetical protein